MNLQLRNIAIILLLAGISGVGSVSAETFDHSHEIYTTILKQHVVNGRVDYLGLKSERNGLDTYLGNSSRVSMKMFQSWTRDEQLAFLINVYNAETLKLIIDHYPVESIKDIGTLFTKPWDLKVVRLFGKKITLNNIEHDMIRKNYREPRIHVALVCAAKGCPILLDTAYIPGRLDEQMSEQTKFFLADKKKNHFDAKSKTLYVSPIFKWYKEDFQDGKGIVPFVRQHANESLAQQLTVKGIRIRYTEYDWSLNDMARKK